MSVTNALKGAVADARPLQNPDFGASGSSP
jgi:hypothetical protein